MDNQEQFRESLELQFKDRKLTDEEVYCIYKDKYRDNFRIAIRDGERVVMRKNKNEGFQEISTKVFEATIQLMLKYNGVHYGSISRVKKIAKLCLANTPPYAD